MKKNRKAAALRVLPTIFAKTSRLTAWASLCLACLAPPAMAAPIHWQTPVTVSADTDVYTRGSLLYAFDESNTAQTLNGVPFAAGNSATTLGGANITMSGLSTVNNTAFGSGAGAPYSGLSAGYKNILKGGAYGGTGSATINLNNLTVGRQYAVQFWVNDNRSSCCYTRTENITSAGGNTQTLVYNSTSAGGGVGQYTIGYFTASGTSQSFTVTPNPSTTGASAQMNAIQVREVSNIGFWNGQASGDWDGASLNFSQNLISAPFSPAGFDTVKAMVPIVYFADTYYHSGAAVTVTRNNVTIGAGGVAGAHVYFVNNGVAYTVSSSDGVGIAGAYGLFALGGGAVTLNGAHTYTGPTVIAAGTLNLNGSLASQVTVSNGATLNLTGSATLAGGLLNYGSVTGPLPLSVGTTLLGAGSLPGAVTVLHGTAITLGNTAGSVATVAMGDLTMQGNTTLNLDLGGTTTPGSGVNDLIQVSGGFTNSGTVTVNFNFTAGLPAMGVPYTIISSSALDPAFNPESFVSTSVIPATFSVSGNDVQVTFTARGYNLVWQGDPNNNTNWAHNVLGWTNVAGDGTLEVFYTLDHVLFDDTATNLVANLPETVFPASVTVNASVNNYTFAGAGGIAGPISVVKSGSGALTLLNANTFTGGLKILDGSVNTGVAGALGPSPVVVSNGGTLNLTAGNTTYTGPNAGLSGDGTVNVTVGTGSQTVTFNGANSNFNGTLNVGVGAAAGAGKIQLNGNLGSNATVNLLAHGTLYCNGATVNHPATAILYGGDTGEIYGQLRVENGAVWSGPVILAGDITGANDGHLGANTGVGTISGVISESGGPRALIKSGNASATIALAAANTFTGPTTVRAGNLRLSHPLALQFSTLSSGGIQFDAAVLTDAFTLGGLAGSGNITLQNISSRPINLSVGNNNADTAYAGALSGSGGLTKIGTGTLTLNGANTYAGATYASEGILQLGASGGISNASSIIVGPAGTFDVSPVTGGFLIKAGQSLGGFGVVTGNVGAVAGGILAPGTVGTPGTLSLSNNLALTNAVLKFDLSSSTEAGNGVNDLIVMNGTLTLDGTTVIQPMLFNGALGEGVYTLISGITSIAAGDVSNLQFGSTVRQSVTLAFVESATPGVTNLVMTVGGTSASLVWAGASDLWDVATSFNWTNTGTVALDQFFNFDNVRFDDTLAGSPLVTLTGAVTPASVLVNNSAVNYTFTGSGGIAGLTGLTKDGAGTLTLSNTLNTYTGPTVVKAGTLRLDYTNAQSAASPLVVSNGAVLDLNATLLGTGAFYWPNTNALTGSGTVRVNTGSGANNIYLWNDMSGFTGILELIANPSGKINLGQMRAGPAPAATLRAQNGATIYLNGGANGKNLNCNVELYGGATGEAYGQLRIDANTTNFGPILLKANTTIGNQSGAASYGYILGAISDDGLGYGFTKQGNGNIVLAAANTFRGDTLFASGTAPLRLQHGLALQNSTVNLTVNNGLTFDAVAGGAFTLGALGGNANLLLQDTANAPITLAVGGNNASTTYSGALSGAGSLTKLGAGTLTLNGANTASGGTVLEGGSLFVNGSVAGPFAMAAGTTLGGGGAIGGPVAMPEGTTLIPGANPDAIGTLTINNGLSLSNRCVLECQLGANTTEGAGINDLIQVNGDLSLSGVITVRVSFVAAPVLNQPYTLFSYTGTLNGGAPNLAVVTDTRSTFALDFSQPNKVRLTVLTGTGNLLWIGGNPTDDWDNKLTANWDPGTGGDPDVFYSGDTVRFENFAASTVVNLVGTVEPAAITVAADDNYLFAGSGAIVGGRLDLNGPGTLTLANSATNSFAFGTFVNGGALQIGNGGTTGALPLGPLTVNSLLAFNRSDNVTESGLIGGTGVVRKEGNNVLTLAGANTHSGGTVISAGTLKVANAQALGDPALGITTVSNGATLDIGAQLLWNYVNPIVLNGHGAAPGLGALTKGEPIFNGVNHIRSIVLGSDAAIGGVTNSRIDIGRGDWATPANLAIGNIHIDGQSNTLSLVGNIYLGILAGATNLAGLVVNTNTSVAPHCDNAFGEAVVTLEGGTLTPWGVGHIFANKIVVNSGFLDNNVGHHQTYTGPIEINGPLQINTIAGGNIVLNGNLTSTGRVTKIGANSLFLGGDNSGFAGAFTNNQSNTFFTNSTAGSAAARWVLNAGNLANVVPGSPTIHLGALSGANGQLGNDLAGSAVTYSIGALGANDQFTGNIVDSVGGGGATAIEKVGAGTLVLAGNNTYSGNTLVSGGTLQYDGTLTAAGGTVTVAGGVLSGNGAIGRPVDVQPGGTLSPGTSIGVLTISNALTLAGTTLLEINKAGLTNDLVRGLASVTYGGALVVTNLGGELVNGDSFKLFDALAYSGVFTSLQLPELPPGLVWNLNQLTASGTISIVPNQPPVAANTNLSAAQNRPATLAAAKLAALCADPEGDPISVTAVGNSTNGALVTLADGIITYTPVTNFVGLDLFPYTITDGWGNYATGKVEVAVYPGNLASLNIVSVARVNGNFQFTFAGIPGRTYQVERALAATGPWTNLTSVVAESTGLTSYLDPNSPAGAAYYRTVYLQP